jgi:AraC-like DNA-binding protein
LPISVRLGQYSAHPIYWGFFKPKWWRNYLHTHSFFEVCYAYSGRGTFRVMNSELAVKSGDLFVAKPSEPHEIVSDRTKPLGIYFWAYKLQQGKSSGGDSSPIESLLEAFFRSKRSVSHGRRGIKQTLELLTQEVAQRAAGFPLVIDGLVTKLMVETARAMLDEAMPAEQMEAPDASANHAVVRIACRYIRDNFSRPLGVRDVASQVHVSERHLGRLFQQVHHASVMAYVTRVRLEAATHLLLDHQLAVKQVAAAVGYPDVHYFTTLFRRRTGLTPGAFRKQRGTRFADPKKRFARNGPPP